MNHIVFKSYYGAVFERKNFDDFAFTLESFSKRNVFIIKLM